MNALPVQPILTVATVVFNAQTLLKRTVDAVSQLSGDIEHVVVDGGSGDGTQAWLESEGKVRRLRWISEQDDGIYDAMNKALDLASGRYIWFLNAGDTPYSSEPFANLASDSMPDIIYGDTALVDIDGCVRKIAQAPIDLTPAHLLEGMCVSHQSLIVRRSIAPRYDRRYRFIADNKWALDCVRRARAVRHVGLLSRYLVGGVSERMYREFWLEKERFTIDELGLLRASPILAKDVMKAMRFYGAKMLRAVRHAS